MLPSKLMQSYLFTMPSLINVGDLLSSYKRLTTCLLTNGLVGGQPVKIVILLFYQLPYKNK